MAATGMFPLLAARFFKDDSEVPHRDAAAVPAPPAAAPRPARSVPLRVLDLATLPRDDGPPTELRTRKEKLAHYGTQCSHVGGHLYVGGETVARSLETLQAAGITHVVNCVGFLYPSFFDKEFDYQTLYLQDTPGEDILCVLYDVFDFIQSAAQNGRVFIHCSQGVSRSCTFAIAYRMWAEERGYDDVFAEVKQMRGVANPNIGFICQLLQWYKRRHEEADFPRLYRIVPQSQSSPLYLVAKPAWVLDPRGAFVLHVGKSLFLWTGSACPEAFVSAARRTCEQLRLYEGASGGIRVVQQGAEPAEFWAAMEVVSAEADRKRSQGGASTPPPADAPADIREVKPLPAYNFDYDLYQRAITPASARGDSCDSARSGRKTPRVELFDAASPNDRLRKQARSEASERERERTSRSSGGTPSASGSSYGIGSDSARARALDFQEMAARRHHGAAPSPSAMTPRGGPGGAGSTMGRLGRPPLTPRSESMGQGGATTARGPSRFAVPRLALPQQSQQQQQQAAAAQAVRLASPASQPTTATDDLSDDDLINSDTASSMADDDSSASDSDNDSDDDAAPTPRGKNGGDDEGNDGTGARRAPPGVPRLNLGS